MPSDPAVDCRLTPAGHVPDGPAHHRAMVRAWGPLVALAIAAAIGALAAVLLVGSTTAVRGIPGFVLALAAVPTLTLVGVPVTGGTTRWVLALLTSGVMWYFVGRLAAVRSTTRPMTGWPEWRREWARLAIGVWAGSLVGLGLAATVLSVSL